MDDARLLQDDDTIRAAVGRQYEILAWLYPNVTDEPRVFPAELIHRYNLLRNEHGFVAEIATSGNPPMGVSSLMFGESKYIVAGTRDLVTSAAQPKKITDTDVRKAIIAAGPEPKAYSIATKLKAEHPEDLRSHEAIRTQVRRAMEK